MIFADKRGLADLSSCFQSYEGSFVTSLTDTSLVMHSARRVLCQLQPVAPPMPGAWWRFRRCAMSKAMSKPGAEDGGGGGGFFVGATLIKSLASGGGKR